MKTAFPYDFEHLRPESNHISLRFGRLRRPNPIFFRSNRKDPIFGVQIVRSEGDPPTPRGGAKGHVIAFAQVSYDL